MPKWVQHLEIHLNNSALNKSYFILAALNELCIIGKLKSVQLVYFIPGHSKVIILFI